MCGISGFLRFSSTSILGPQHLQDMLNAIRHRGPDGSYQFSEKNRISLGAVRLAMVDTQAPAQILTNEDSSLYLVYNGEIYNAPKLRQMLENLGHKFNGKNDGEVIVHLYEEKGDDFLLDLDGMFAFALWDSHKEALLIARDRMGIKPLFYKKTDEEILFASEMRAILEVEQSLPQINSEALKDYLRFRFIPAPHTIFQGIQKLEPGSYLFIHQGHVRKETYWEPRFGNSIDQDFQGIFEEAILTTAASETPLGIFLSGGLDSTAILWCLSKFGRTPPSFTIGYEFRGQEDEGALAKEIATQFGCSNDYLQITNDELLSLFQKSLGHLEEPLYSTVSSSTYALAGLAAQKVKGILSGDGADELLMGYSYLLNPLRAFKEGGDWQKSYYEQIDWISPSWADILLENPLLLHLPHPLPSPSSLSPLDTFRYWEIRYRLPDYHLTRIDRLTMAHGIEGRVPFLRNKIVEWALGLSTETLLVPENQKRWLKNLLSHTLPRKITHKQKQPFTSPFVSWIKGPLKQEIHELLLMTDYHSTLGIKKEGLTRLLHNCYQGEQSGFQELWGMFILFKWIHSTELAIR